MSRLSLILAALVGLLAPAPARALDPGRSLRQLHHTAWTIEDGAPPDIWALAQTPDGYLWLGTGAGLYHFDGVRFEKFRTQGGEQMPSSNINSLFATPSGDLWIGYVTGDISRLRAGRLETFSLGLPGAPINQIAGGEDGVIWATARGYEHGGLARFADDRWRMVGTAWGFPSGGASGVLAAKDGSLWVTANRTLLVLRRGSKRFALTGERLLDLTRAAQGPDGRIWLSSGPGTTPHPLREAGRKDRPPLASRPSATSVAVSEPGRMLIDRDGALWGTYQVGGVFRISAASRVGAGRSANGALIESFSLKDGLTSDLATPLLEDREGDIWVGTNLGLDRFRATNAVAASGVPVTSRHGFQAAPGEGGAIYVTTGDTLYRADPTGRARQLTRLPSTPSFLYTDRDRAVWMGLNDGLARYEHGHLSRVALPAVAAGRVSGWMQDRLGLIWISVLQGGVFRFLNGVATPQRLALAPPRQMATDARGRPWFNYGGKLALVQDGRLRAFSRTDGLSIGDIGIVSAGPSDLLVGGDFGIARFDGRRFQVLRSERTPVLSRISGIVQTARGDTWLNGIRGVVRIATTELDQAFEHPERPLHYQLFDLRDGLPGVAQQDSGAPTALEGGDGRLWFVTSHGVAWIDPAHLVRNPLPPPVSIRALTANGEEHAYPTTLQLAEGASNLQIDYTALSLSIPERVRFRYQLEGVDSGWIDPGTRRQAFYTRLGPGHYRFHVIAANNDGVWNTTGASLDFTIPPTFVQSRIFLVLVGIAALVVLWLLYSWRLSQVAGRIRGRLEERLNERERIARELHDTLLQGFQGLVLRFQAVAESIPAAHASRRMMEQSLDRADQVLAEGRDRVLNLRTEDRQGDLTQAFTAAAERLSYAAGPEFSVIVEGRQRRLHPLAQEEIARITEEGLSNAFRHAQATAIEVSIIYLARELQIHLRDNGVGIDPEIMASGGRHHHFGMIGMRERADTIKGLLSVSTRPGAGTEITLSVPGKVAYAEARRRSWGASGRSASMTA